MTVLYIVYAAPGGYIESIRDGYEFFTDEEPANPMFAHMVETINTGELCIVGGQSDIQQLEMKNVTYILCKKRESSSGKEDVGSNMVPLEFSFSNATAVTIGCPITDAKEMDLLEFVGKTIGKCKKIGEAVLTFSNCEETIIVNRRFLTSVHVKR